MKRLYERIPLRSVLYCVRGDQDVRIIDGGEIIFEGKELDIMKAQFARKLPYRIDYAEIHGVKVDGNVLVFEINTKYEEF